MSWWFRRAGLLLVLLVVFFSCEEEESIIGIKSTNAKFRVSYAEIDVPSSVILFDKLSTTTLRGNTEVQRFLVGQYQDSEFGTIRAEIFTQISPAIDKSAVSVNAVMDSLVLQLQADFYYYGSKSISNQTIQIHELTDTLNQVPYYNNSKVGYKAEIIGEKLITIDPTKFDKAISRNSDSNKNNDTTQNFRINLSGNFAKDLFETLRTDTTVINDFTKFTGKHKGLAIIPTSSDKILGINPFIDESSVTKGTKLVLYYTEGGVHKEIRFVMYPFDNNPVRGFSSIESNRAGTALQSMNEPNKDFFPIDNKRYVQSGTGILTKLDFTKFFEFMDTVSIPVINSAELVFENESSEFPPPSQFQFRVLNEQNYYGSFLQDTVVDGKKYVKNNVLELRAAYPSVSPNEDGTIDLLSDAGGGSVLKVGTNSTNIMSVFLTAFFQDQYAQRKNEKRIKYCAFHPLESQFRKSVNRLVLKDKIKLRVYYTSPVVENSN